MKELWARMTPEERSAYQKRIHPNQSAVTSRQMYERWAKCTGEARARRCAHLTNPEAQAKSHAAQRTPEFLAKRSAWAKAAYARMTPEARERIAAGYRAWRAAHPAKGRKRDVLVFRGEAHTQAEWARILGIGPTTICTRLKRGWPLEKALEPTHGRHDPKRSRSILTFRGETHTQAGWARILGVTRATICTRLKRGWPLERVLQPARPLSADCK